MYSTRSWKNYLGKFGGLVYWWARPVWIVLIKTEDNLMLMSRFMGRLEKSRQYVYKAWKPIKNPLKASKMDADADI